MIASLLAAVALCAAAGSCAGLYQLPVVIGAARRVPGLGGVAVINVTLGWTLAGRAVALILALRSICPAPPAVHISQVFPAAPPQRPRPPQLILPPRPGAPGPSPGGRP